MKWPSDGVRRKSGTFSIRHVCRRPCTNIIAVLTGPRRPGNPASLVAEAGKAHSDLGRLRRFVGIEEIVSSAWRRMHGKGMHAKPIDAKEQVS